ncbi:MAG: HAD-IA family hydrolase [Candidatus Nealsonbacteria bacterium]|nr:HAD-IA family hydrolase [Candidatus Nealsonbacteria bacterium]
MEPKLLIFDFWKTLVFSPNRDPRKFYSGLERFGIGIKEGEEKKFSHLFSKGMCLSESWEDFSKIILENFSTNQTKENIGSFADFLKKKVGFEFYDDVKIISTLPYEKVILTDSARFLMEPLENMDHFTRIFTPQDTKALKPDLKVFSTVAEEMSVEPEKTIMVGDDPERDLVPAQKLGMKTVLIDRKDNYKNWRGAKIATFKELESTIKGL